VYQKLRKHARSVSESPSVAVGSGGAVYLSAFAMRQFFKGVKQVHLLYDPEARKLAVQVAKDADPDAFRLNFSNKTASTGVVAARSVVKQLGLDYTKETLVYPAEWNDRLKALEVDLRSVPQKRRR